MPLKAKNIICIFAEKNLPSPALPTCLMKFLPWTRSYSRGSQYTNEQHRWVLVLRLQEPTYLVHWYITILHLLSDSRVNLPNFVKLHQG